MDFNKLIKIRIFPLLQNYGFIIIKELPNVVWFQSEKIEILFSYSEYEKMCSLSLGKNGGRLYEVNDKVVLNFFNDNLSLENIKPMSFVDNVSTLLSSKDGEKILEGHIEKIIDFILVEIHNYNIQLLLKQNLSTALGFWEIQDYRNFIKTVDKIGVQNLSLSFQRKYKIAQNKLL